MAAGTSSPACRPDQQAQIALALMVRVKDDHEPSALPRFYHRLQRGRSIWRWRSGDLDTQSDTRRASQAATWPAKPL
jgi:hypothetical protein